MIKVPFSFKAILIDAIRPLVAFCERILAVLDLKSIAAHDPVDALQEFHELDGWVSRPNLQLRDIAAMGGTAFVVATLALGLTALLVTPPVGLFKDDSQTTSATTFQPTARQLANLTIASAQPKMFPSVVSADGYIAGNDNLTMPVFSPSSGRVVRTIASVREEDALFVRLGDAVNVRLREFPGRIFRAKISYVAPLMDPETHRLPICADVDNTDGALKPKMTASFEIVTGRDEIAHVIPQRAVIYEGGTARVWVQPPNGQLTSRVLQVGRTGGDPIEALNGVRAGDKVVTEGASLTGLAGSSNFE